MPNLGVAPPAYNTNTGLVRALLGDDDAENVTSGVGEYAWYSDDAINGLLTVYSDSPKRAAAQALRTVASSQALLLKKFSADDLSVDGPAIAEALRKLAADLDAQADGGDSGVDIFELSYPGGNPAFIPEGFPADFGVRWGRAGYGVTSGTTGYQDEGLTQDGGLLG